MLVRFTGGAGTQTFGGDFVRRQYRRARWSSTDNHDESPDGISCLDDTQTEGRFSDAVRRVGRREATESFGSERTAGLPGMEPRVRRRFVRRYRHNWATATTETSGSSQGSDSARCKRFSTEGGERLWGRCAGNNVPPFLPSEAGGEVGLIGGG